MKMFYKSCVSAGFALLLSGSAMGATVIGNKDVISLLEAGMPEEIIVQAIQAGERKFDTSASALIKLREKGATPSILSAILGKPAAAAATNSSASAASSNLAPVANGLNPEEILVVVNGKETNLQYIIPGNRAAARALGFGGFATYAVLNGERAARRLESNTPEFIVSVPKNAQADNYITLASFAVRNNSTREVSTGGGYLSYSSGINKSRVVPITSEKMADQSRAREGFMLYRVKPEQSLASGEYALVLYTGEVRSVGFFSQASNSYFDFGID